MELNVKQGTVCYLNLLIQGSIVSLAVYLNFTYYRSVGGMQIVCLSCRVVNQTLI